MVFFRELWKKKALELAEASPSLPSTRPQSDLHIDDLPVLTDDKVSSVFLKQRYAEQLNILAREEQGLQANMAHLKAWSQEPRESHPDLRFSHIQNRLQIPELYETLRQERWVNGVYCPACGSTQIERIVPLPEQSPNNHRYHCIECLFEFNDDTDAPFSEDSHPSMQMWIECWYLWACTDSLHYIAHRLGLDLKTVERMIFRLKQFFQSEKPFSRDALSLEEKAEMAQLNKRYKVELQERYERLNMQTTKMPFDTLQYRQREAIRRHGKLDPNLVNNPKVKPSRKR